MWNVCNSKSFLFPWKSRPPAYWVPPPGPGRWPDVEQSWYIKERSDLCWFLSSATAGRGILPMTFSSISWPRWSTSSTESESNWNKCFSPCGLFHKTVKRVSSSGQSSFYDLGNELSRRAWTPNPPLFTSSKFSSNPRPTQSVCIFAELSSVCLLYLVSGFFSISLFLETFPHLDMTCLLVSFRIYIPFFVVGA